MSGSHNSPHLRHIQTLEGHKDPVWGLSWHPNKRYPAMFASCSGDTTVCLWEQSSPSSSTFQLMEVLEGQHTRTVRSCAWSPSGEMLATASFDGTVAIWANYGDYVFAGTLQGHKKEVKSVSWSAGGELIATCGRDKSVRIWEADSDVYTKFECVSVLQGHTADVKMVQWHPLMNILFSCGFDNSIKIWAEEVYDQHDWHCVQTLNTANNGHSSTVWSLSFNEPGDKMVTCSDDCTIKVWGRDNLRGHVALWRHLHTFSGYHDRTIYSVHWSSGVIASGAGDNAICLFVENEDGLVDGPAYRLLTKKVQAHGMDVNCVEWSPMEKPVLASASDDCTIKIWELASASKVWKPCEPIRVAF